MGTRPATIGYWLTDSPVGSAASLTRIRRMDRRGQRPRAPPHQRRDARRHHAFLLGRRRRPRPACAQRTTATKPGSAANRPCGRGQVPRRDDPRAARLGRARLPQPRVLQQTRQGRPLRAWNNQNSCGGVRAAVGRCADPCTSASVRWHRRVEHHRGQSRGHVERPIQLQRWPSPARPWRQAQESPGAGLFWLSPAFAPTQSRTQATQVRVREASDAPVTQQNSVLRHTMAPVSNRCVEPNYPGWMRSNSG